MRGSSLINLVRGARMLWLASLCATFTAAPALAQPAEQRSPPIRATVPDRIDDVGPRQTQDSRTISIPSERSAREELKVPPVPPLSAELDPFFASVPASSHLRRTLASGTQHDYRLTVVDGDEPIGAITPTPWRGLILLRDPAESGSLATWDANESEWQTVSLDQGVSPYALWYRNPEGTYTKRLLGKDGMLIGTTTIGPGRRFSVNLDGNADGVVDVVYSEWPRFGTVKNPRLRKIIAANEHGPGLAMLEELWRGRVPGCGPENVGLRPGRPSATIPGSIDACPDSGSNGGGGGNGIGVTGSDGEDQSELGRRCKQILSDGPPGPQVGLASDPNDKGMAGEVVDWIMNGSDGERDSAGVNTLRTVGGGWIAVGEAAVWDNVAEGPFGLLEAWGKADQREIESGEEPFGYGKVTEPEGDVEQEPSGGASADGGTYYDTTGDGKLDSKDTDGDGKPDTNVSPGGGDNAGAGGGGKTQPGPGPDGMEGPGSGHSMAEYQACARKAREQGLIEGDDPIDSPVTQKCRNPASDPRPYTGGAGSNATELDTYCGNREDGERADLEDILAGGAPSGGDCKGGGLQSALGKGGCGDDIFSDGGSKGTIGVAFGSLIGIDTCDPSVCQRPPNRR